MLPQSTQERVIVRAQHIIADVECFVCKTCRICLKKLGIADPEKVKSLVLRRDGVIEVLGSGNYILWFHSLSENKIVLCI